MGTFNRFLDGGHPWRLGLDVTVVIISYLVDLPLWLVRY